MNSYDEFIPTLTHATERDVDLLLVEEIHCSRDFTSWLAEQAGLSSRFTTWDVRHSKRRIRSRREIDIFVEFTGFDGRRSALLIENKIDAAEQPEQAESYRAELDALGSEDIQAAMLLVCPESYAAAQKTFAVKFDAVVTYEEVSNRLRQLPPEEDPELVFRTSFRADLIDQAVYKYRRGYTPVPNAVIGDFNARYVALLAEVAPEIIPGKTMLKPANPNGSSSMIFDQDASLGGLSREIRPRRFSHELSQGHRATHYVAVTFPGWGVAIDQLIGKLEADTRGLGASFSAKKPNSQRPNPGLVMTIPTEPVDNQGNFESQRSEIEAGMKAAADLRRWLLSNSDLLEEWKKLVDQLKDNSEGARRLG